MKEIFIGILSGIVSGLGMGGGTILILLLTLFLGIEQHISQATNVIFFVPTAISAIIIFIKNKNINFKIGIPICLFGIIGATIGSILSTKMNVTTLKKYFGIFLILIAVHEIYYLFRMYRKEENRNNTIK